MRCYAILAEALGEFEEASRWYEQRDAGVGLALVAEYPARLERAPATPSAGALVGKTPGGASIRRFSLKRFNRYGLMLAVIDGVPTRLG